MNADRSTGQIALDFIRQLSAHHGCRLEFCSDPGDLPISASDRAREAYGFGKTVEEAVHNLATNPRKVP